MNHKTIPSFLASIFLASALCWGDGKEYPNQTEQYCMLMATEKFLSLKVNIVVDFGEEKKQTLKDENGKDISFNSVVDALNYMNSKGWEFVNAYAISAGSSGTIYHFLMKKKK